MNLIRKILILSTFCQITFAFTIPSSESDQLIEYAEGDTTMRLTAKEFEVFSMLLSPNDTRLQKETKVLLAQYLIAQAVADVDKKRATETTGGTTIQSSSPVAIDAVSASGKQTMSTPVATTVSPTTLHPTVPPAHVLNQVDKILGNVATGNVVGIVDNSLAIRAPSPVRALVTGILQLVFCNPFDRLLNRCRQTLGPVAATSPSRNAAGIFSNSAGIKLGGNGNRIRL